MSIYVKPIITEKFSAMADKGRYAFVVEKTANKVEIKNAIEKAYGVTVQSVNTMKYIGKIKMRYTATKIMQGLVKKSKKAEPKHPK